ncbi:hypothetical protein BDW71DRAFT_208624 [Aspergillus fruticulosus]
MPPKVADDSKQRTTTRRKVALACDSCREKKVRCDGNKPISGPCMRRAYRIDQCVYNTDNARSASRDEYFQTIRQRIRELEDACLRAGVSIDSSPGPQARRELLSEPNGHSEIPVQAGSPSLTVPHDSGKAAGPDPGPTSFGVGVTPGHWVLATRSESANSESGTAVEEATECTQMQGRTNSL